MATKFDVEERWPKLFAQLDDTQRRAAMQSLAIGWHEGFDPTREEVKNLTDYAAGTIKLNEYRRHTQAAAERGSFPLDLKLHG